MSSIVVTGAFGFIGTHVVPLLREAGHDVLEIDISSGNVVDESTWVNLPQREVVIHLAGRPFVPDSWAEPALFLRTNLLGTVAALDYCRRHGARLVFVSSYLYGAPDRLPIPEHAPLVATNPYGLSKKLAEEVCRFYSDRFGISVTILRLFNVYGAGQSREFLIPSIVRQVRAGEQIRVRDLAPKRDYVYVSDVAEAIARAVECQRAGSVFNIGTGISHSVEEVIQVIQAVWGTNLDVISSEERRQDEVMNTVADIAEAKRYLGWEPKFTLPHGIREIYCSDTPVG